MLILHSQMRRAAIVSLEVQFLEPRNGDPQSLLYSLQSALAQILSHLGDLIEKIAAIGIIRTPD